MHIFLYIKELNFYIKFHKLFRLLYLYLNLIQIELHNYRIDH